MGWSLSSAPVGVQTQEHPPHASRSPRMRLATNLVIILVALAVSAAVYAFTGGKVIFFFLPLLFAPLLFRRRA